MSKILLIVFSMCIYINAIELNKQLFMDISRTYGYITAQTLVADKLKKKYPNKIYELNKAQIEFDLSFKSSMENIKKAVGEKEWAKYEAMIIMSSFVKTT